MTTATAFTATYELTVVHRIPQQNTRPVFLEIDPIDFTNLTYSDELNKPQTLEASCLISSLTEPIITRLRALHENPTELWLSRNNAIIYQGPLLGWSAQRDKITFRSQGLLSYLRWMLIDNDYNLTTDDTFAIAAFLIDQFQGIEYAHMGIETGDAGFSFENIDILYEKKELIHIDKALEDLAKAQGFDFEIEPGSRNLRLYSPEKGVDRSTGDDAVVFDASNIDNWDAQSSCGPEDYGNLAYGTSTDTEAGTLISVLHNPDARALFGTTGISQTFDKLTNDNDLGVATNEFLQGHDSAFMVPGPTVRVTSDTDLSQYAVGDTVSYVLNDRLGLSGDFRLRKRTVNVNPPGREVVTLEFV